MRQHYLITLFFLHVIFTQAYSQSVTSYNFSEAVADYKPLIQPQQIAFSRSFNGSEALEDQFYVLDNVLPFDFPFLSESFNSLTVYVNGFVSFGSTNQSSNAPIYSNLPFEGVISPMGTDLKGLFDEQGKTASINYEILGVAPHRIFVIEWNHFTTDTSPFDSNHYYDLNFQLHLHEDGKIVFSYDSKSIGIPQRAKVNVGLRGSNNRDFNNRVGNHNTADFWINSVSGTSNTQTLSLSYAHVPSDGIQFSWENQSDLSVGNCYSKSSFYEDFESGNIDEIPECWNVISQSNSSRVPTVKVERPNRFIPSRTIVFADNGANFDREETKMLLISPKLSNLNRGTHRLRFKAAVSSSSFRSNLQLRFLAMNSTSSTNSYVVLDSIVVEDTSLKQYVVEIKSFAGQQSYLGIERVGGDAYTNLYIDDIYWEEIPACPSTDNLYVIHSTHDGALINWSAGSSINHNATHEFYIGQNSSFPSNNALFDTVDEEEILLKYLNPGVHYFWLRSICDTGSTSAWQTVSFTTLKSTTVPFKEQFNNRRIPNGWQAADWDVGVIRGNTGVGETNLNLYCNLNAYQPKAEFTTLGIGPLNSPNYELHFKYKQSNYRAPYEATLDWGYFEVQLSSDGGQNWSFLDIISNNQEAAGYLSKLYSLERYMGKFVQLRIKAHRNTGDFDLSFDDFEVKEKSDVVTDGYCPVYVIQEVKPFTKLKVQTISGINEVQINLDQGSIPPVEDQENQWAREASFFLIANDSLSLTNQRVQVFVDWNQDGFFDGSDEVYDMGILKQSVSEEVRIQFTVPNHALSGSTRMRVLKHNGQQLHNGCSEILQGQVVDLVLEIVEALNLDEHEKVNINIYPNPATDVLLIESDLIFNKIKLFSILGQEINVVKHGNMLFLSKLNTGVYWLHLEGENGKIYPKKFLKK